MLPSGNNQMMLSKQRGMQFNKARPMIAKKSIQNMNMRQPNNYISHLQSVFSNLAGMGG
jgi:hypothetical protein